MINKEGKIENKLLVLALCAYYAIALIGTYLIDRSGCVTLGVLLGGIMLMTKELIGYRRMAK